MDLTQFGLTEVSLMDGERVDIALDLAGSNEALLLTPRRVMHLHGNGRKILVRHQPYLFERR